MEKLRIAGIVDESVVDGTGFRLTIFTQGCPHHCEGCHNQHTWDFDGGELIEINEIIEKVKRNPLLDGITLSGGEPFEQYQTLIELCKQVKSLGLSVWCYTGYTIEELTRGRLVCAQLLDYIDVLIDGRFQQDKLNLMLKFRGSSNQRIIDINASKASNYKNLILLD